MRFHTLNGKLVNKNVNKYRLNWDKKSLSIFQFKVKQFLKPYWQHHIVFEEFPVYQTRLHVDILNATLKVAIECDGHFHNEYSPFFHNNNSANFLTSIKNDIKKEEWLEKNNFKLIRINYDELNLLSKEFFIEKFNFQL